MPYSLVDWQYLTPQTADRFNQMESNAVFTSEHRIWGCEIETTGTSTITVLGGRIEIGGKWLSRVGSLTALTAETNGDWVEGATQEASSTAMYIVAFNDSGSSFNVKFRLSGPAYSDTASGTSTGPKIYDKSGTTWYRYIGQVANDDDNAIVSQRQDGNYVTYDYVANNTGVRILNNTGTSTFTDLNTLHLVPPFSTICSFQINNGGAQGTFETRRNGTTVAAGLKNIIVAGGDNVIPLVKLDGSGVVEYKASTVMSAYVAGYDISPLRNG